jgi:hypothetical protein
MLGTCLRMTIGLVYIGVGAFAPIEPAFVSGLFMAVGVAAIALAIALAGPLPGECGR